MTKYDRENPGPGAYHSPTSSKVPGGDFSKGKRLAKNRHDSPGPGNYDHQTKIAEGPSYTLRSRQGSKANMMDNPGPGNYTPNVGN